MPRSRQRRRSRKMLRRGLSSCQCLCAAKAASWKYTRSWSPWMVRDSHVLSSGLIVFNCGLKNVGSDFTSYWKIAAITCSVMWIVDPIPVFQVWQVLSAINWSRRWSWKVTPILRLFWKRRGRLTNEPISGRKRNDFRQRMYIAAKQQIYRFANWSGS